MVASEVERKTILSETGPVTPTAPDFPQALLQGARFPPPGAALFCQLLPRYANARICAGFHYRCSTIAGREMGQKIGEYVVRSVMQPVQSAMAQ